MKTKTKKVIALVALVALVTTPIFRWNLTPGKTHYSIVESIASQEVPTIELVAGNIYWTVVETYNDIVYK